MRTLTAGIAIPMVALVGCNTPVSDPLSSWNEGAAKQSIVEFVESVTDQGSSAYVAPAERIA
ncbi:MAG: haloacid dehalogenase-like hydrolase, partial [Gemmatimonadota bacterium]